MSFLQATITTNVTLSSADAPIVWNSEADLEGSDISLNTGTGTVTVQAGTYLFTATISTQPTVAHTATFRLVDTTGTDADVDGAECRIYNATSGTDSGGSQLLQRVLVVTAETEYQVQITSATSTPLREEFTNLSVIKLEENANGGFVVAARTAEQTLTTTGQNIDWSSLVDSSGSDIALDVTTNVGRVTVQPGTYLFTCNIDFRVASGGAGRFFSLWDVTGTATEVPATEVLVWNAPGAAGVGGSSNIFRVVTVSVESDFEIRITHSVTAIVMPGGSVLNIARIA